MTRSRDTIMKSRAAAIAGAWDTDDVVAGITRFWTHPRAGAMYFLAMEAAATRKTSMVQRQELHRGEPGPGRDPVRFGAF